MISIYQLKSEFQRMLTPLLHGLKKMGVTPNQLTLSAIFLSAGIGVLIYFHSHHSYFLLLAAFGLLVRMMLNALDGMMAKTFLLQSKLGDVLNEVGDVLSDFFVFCPLFVFSEIHPLLVLSFILLSALNEFAGILAKAISGERRYDGPMGKSDRALVIGLYLIVSYFVQPVDFYATLFFSLVILLVLISTFIRLKRGLK